MKKFYVVILALILSSCGEVNRKIPLLYQANFDASKIEEVEGAMEIISKKWGLRLFQKDRERMKYLTQGKEAFFIALYFNGDAVLSLNNVGVGEVLSLMIVDYGIMPKNDLERLTNETLLILKTQLSIEFEKERNMADQSDASG